MRNDLFWYQRMFKTSFLILQFKSDIFSVCLSNLYRLPRFQTSSARKVASLFGRWTSRKEYWAFSVIEPVLESKKDSRYVKSERENKFWNLSLNYFKGWRWAQNLFWWFLYSNGEHALPSLEVVSSTPLIICEK